MKIARYWTRADAEASSPAGERFHARARGWADDSVESARVCAREIARRVAERRAAGSTERKQYPYGDRPLPEPIIREFPGAGALVTRNAYGALVLNADHLLFADIDVQPPSTNTAGSLGRAFSALFGAAKPASPPADPMIDRMNGVTIRHGRKARLYRTAAGYRLMITDAQYEPGSPEAEALLAQYGADPLYVRLCRMQKSFRARLTPKPWRCSMRIPPGEFPYETSEAQSRYSRWEREYNAKIAAFATCRFVADLGSGDTEDEFRDLIDFHDRETMAAQALPLA